MILLSLAVPLDQVMEDVQQKWVIRTVATDGETSSSSLLRSIPPLLWSLVQQRLLPLVELNMGAGECHVIRWSHKYFSEYATSRYLCSDDQIQHTYAALADYFSGESIPSHMKQKEKEGITDCIFCVNFTLALFDPLQMSGALLHCLPHSANLSSCVRRRSSITCASSQNFPSAWLGVGGRKSCLPCSLTTAG